MVGESEADLPWSSLPRFAACFALANICHGSRRFAPLAGGRLRGVYVSGAGSGKRPPRH